jgi:hypothetical protein
MRSPDGTIRGISVTRQAYALLLGGSTLAKGPPASPRSN